MAQPPQDPPPPKAPPPGGYGNPSPGARDEGPLPPFITPPRQAVPRPQAPVPSPSRKGWLAGAPILAVVVGCLRLFTVCGRTSHYDSYSPSFSYPDHIVDSHQRARAETTARPAATAVSARVQPTLLATDGSSLFQVDGDGAIVSLPLAGGAPLVLSPYGVAADQMAVDATHVYWTTWSELAAVGSLQRKTKKGGTIETIATIGQPWALAVDDAKIYLASLESGTYALRARPKTGGDWTLLAQTRFPVVAVVASGELVSFLSDDAVATVSKKGGAVKVVDGASDVRLLASGGNGAVGMSGGGALTALVSGVGKLIPLGADPPQEDGASLAADGASVCWQAVTNANLPIRCVPLRGGPPITVATPASSSPLVVQKGRVYFADQGVVKWASTTAKAPEAHWLSPVK